MRKTTILLLTIALMQSLSAQDYYSNYYSNSPSYYYTEPKRMMFGIYIVQHFGDSKQWSEIGYVNNGLPAQELTEIRFVYNYYFFEEDTHSMGFFADLGIGKMPAPKMKSFNFDRMNLFSSDKVPMPNNGTQYFLREILYESRNGNTHFKMTGGIFIGLPINIERIGMIFYGGIGYLSMPKRECDMILKEEGSNMQYQTKYIWSNNKGKAGLYYMNLRYNFMYELNKKSNLILGFDATLFLNKLNFYGKYTSSFDANIEQEFSVKGNKDIGMLGLSMGISF